MPESSYNTVSDVRRGDAVSLPLLAEEDKFVLLKMEDGENARVTLYNLTQSEAIDALMGVVMALNG